VLFSNTVSSSKTLCFQSEQIGLSRAQRQGCGNAWLMM
jgi:hypothetical protein